ncbi:membrane protein insertion efficiency factor YidD [Candidatus Uhrbacteria bacterium RIFCSPHIGHO2_01_FULL_63_20]|uniref:Putative membrane protein insertion efficiency factor n=1 Tax=Candidatus Uhrbacteria bacterium RIFCSPHIGHO2_01_FULL_63_20 TaxID=1802385 RepID=A0A1F7TM33_9BACT|nr:MAG: membrane protein insertion efficiency factor YidD [Candidatus Uhrbacteria bacterium RIFCSPHIGHO2_01_FULL_63_20]
MKTLFVWIIKGYQATLSPDHGPLRAFHPYGYCKFHPTCSSYAIEAIGRFGAAKGGWFAMKRLIRCHPWSSGGIDEVPKQKTA